MRAYAIRRLILAVPLIVAVASIVFLVLHIVPGDPVQVLTGRRTTPPAVKEELRRQYGFDQPIYRQYGDYMSSLARGDLGRSITSKRPVTREIRDALPHTARLAGASLAIAIPAGILIGIFAALKRGRWPDTLSMAAVVTAVSLPSFWLALLFVYFFSFRLGWFPATGAEGAKSLILPAAVLGLIEAGVIARYTRAAMVEVLGQDYVRTARAKGLREWDVVMRHAARNALIPVITVIGLELGALLTGAIFVEAIFSRPGLGRLAVDAVVNRDFPLIEGVTLFIAAIYVFLNLAVDLSYTLVDPRVRYR